MMNHLRDFTQANAEFSLMSWEPIFGSGERLNVAALFQYKGQFDSRLLIRTDVLQCMYGQAGASAYKMIGTNLEASTVIAKRYGMAAALSAVPLANFFLSEPRQTIALNEQDLLRQIILMNCSLGLVVDAAASVSDEQTILVQKQQWATKIRNVIKVLRPNLRHCFNKRLALVENGSTIRFDVVTDTLVTDFGLLNVRQKNDGMKDIRAKILELELAKQRHNLSIAALIYGTPRDGDITLSNTEQNKLIANIKELEQVAMQRGLVAKHVHTPEEAADSVVSLV